MKKKIIDYKNSVPECADSVSVRKLDPSCVHRVQYLKKRATSSEDMGH